MRFNWDILSDDDRLLAYQIIGDDHYHPDVTIAPDGKPYLYRWWIVPRNGQGNVYFHIQVASDPERGLHDHPWDNVSVILSGGCEEVIQRMPPFGREETITRRVGDVIPRQAADAHRLILPAGIPYTMTLFTTGPKIREWGFWEPSHRGRPEWKPWKEVTQQAEDGAWVHNGLV